MDCFVSLRVVGGVLCVARLLSVTVLGGQVGGRRPCPGLGGGTCASLGAGRVATIRALLCAYVRR